MIYATYVIFGEPCSGVIRGQAIDTCNYLSNSSPLKVRIVSLISIRNFFSEKNKYKKYCPDCIVFPLIFKGNPNWFYSLLLYIFVLKGKNNTFVGRGAKATFMLLKLRTIARNVRVVYDGRGAHKAEVQEYFSEKYGWSSRKIKKEISYERESVLNTDYRISVSFNLIKYWQDEYHYDGTNHVVVPCTLSEDFLNVLSEAEIEKVRTLLGYNNEDIVFVYSGSVAGWQSFSVLEDYIKNILENNKSAKVLFLSKIDLKTLSTYYTYKDRLAQKWLAPDQVFSILSACDYGLLLREESKTNEVAAPVKFAEYLSAGLPVLISSDIGDYSTFIAENNCGVDIRKAILTFQRPTFTDKKRLNKLSRIFFNKKSYKDLLLKAFGADLLQ